MTKEESVICSKVLDFAMCADEFGEYLPFVANSHAFNAAEKIDAMMFSFSKSEVKALISSIDYSLQHINDCSDLTSCIEENFPGIITSLQESVTVLESLKPRLSAFSAKLSRSR